MMISAVKDDIVDTINDCMGDIQYDEIKLSDEYIEKNFSVFAHHIPKQEFRKKILNYKNAVEKINIDKSKKYFEYYDRLLRFFLDIYIYNRTKV